MLGEATHTRRRFTGARGSDGRWTATSVDTTFTGSLQPATQRDLRVLPEGVRQSDARKVYCAPGTLRTADPVAQVDADHVLVEGQAFRVMAVQTYTVLLPHDRATLLRVTESSVAGAP